MEIKEQIIVLVKSKKSKTINIKEIRENLNLEYTPQNEKILKITSDDVQAYNTLEWNASSEMIFAKESEYLERVHTL